MSLLVFLVLFTGSQASLSSATSPVLLQQGIFGPNSHCESVCSNVCDSPACLQTCAERFCLQAQATGIPWIYLVLVLVVLAVLATVVKVVFGKIAQGRRGMEEGEAARYYHSL